MNKLFIPTLLALLTGMSHAGYEVAIPLENDKGGRLPVSSIVFVGGNGVTDNGTPTDPTNPTDPVDEVEPETPEDELGLKTACLTDVLAYANDNTYWSSPRMTYSTSYNNKVCTLSISSLSKMMVPADYAYNYQKVEYAAYMGQEENEGLSVVAKFTDNPSLLYSGGRMNTTNLFTQVINQKCGAVYNQAVSYASGKDLTIYYTPISSNGLSFFTTLPACGISIYDNVYKDGVGVDINSPEYLENCVVRNNLLNNIHHYVNNQLKSNNLTGVYTDYNYACPGIDYDMTTPDKFQ